MKVPYDLRKGGDFVATGQELYTLLSLNNCLDLTVKDCALLCGFLVTIIPPECTKSVELFEDTDLDVCDHLSYLTTQIIGF
jgi:hypothetical protein